jgi:hypothetical protein
MYYIPVESYGLLDPLPSLLVSDWKWTPDIPKINQLLYLI